MITGYFMAPVRGEDGDDVIYEVKWRNIHRALEIAEWLKRKFPEVDWYIPHIHEEFIEALGLSSATSLEAFAKIAASRDFGVAYDGECFSNGMAVEYEAMSMAGKPVMCFAQTSDTAREQIAQVIASVEREDIQVQ